MSLVIFIAFLSPLLYAFTGVMDSFMSKGQKGHPLSFALYLFFAYFISSFAVFFYGNPVFPDQRAWIFLFLIALTDVLYLIPYYKALKIADSSVVAALFSLGRVFMPVFAYLLFKEELATIQYIGFFIVIFSCIFLSVGHSLKKLFFNKKVFLLMSAASIILTIQAFLYKYSFEYVTWDTSFFTVACLSFLISSSLFFIPKMRKDIKLNYKYAKKI